MKITDTTISLVAGFALLLIASRADAQDWPQWRGANRDAKAAGFTAPQTWPKELTRKWKVTVGEGAAAPSLVGDRLFVFARQEGKEVIQCLDAATGKELWRDQHDALGAEGPASGHSGPRCSPTVADGKVITLGLRGVLSCHDAVAGKLLWRKEDFQGAWPRFFTSASPLVADGLCVAVLGGPGRGGVVAYDLAAGVERWKWTGDGAAYASPVLLTVGGRPFVLTPTDSKVVALDLADGHLAWETPFVVEGRGYNAATPIVDGAKVIYLGSGRGATAVEFRREADRLTAQQLWKTTEHSVQFNTPVLKSGFLYGLNAGNDFFCLNAQDGTTCWTAPSAPAAADATATPPAAGAPGGRGGRGGRSPVGFGSIVDAGSVLLALTPASTLIAFAADGTAYKELARLKVAESPSYAYPVVSGNRVFIKDQDAVALWTVE